MLVMTTVPLSLYPPLPDNNNSNNNNNNTDTSPTELSANNDNAVPRMHGLLLRFVHRHLSPSIYY